MDSKNIIIVDDDAAILDSLNLMLNFEGFEVNPFKKEKNYLNFWKMILNRI